jgi:transcriptional regulator with XRE-family HTH domain
MVRARKRPPPPPPADDVADEPDPPLRDGPIDVNAVVSYNLKAAREKRGWTQQHVADQLGELTGHTLPQASISAMERGYDGERRRRFDAHELYLLSEVFAIPIPYFFLPPPGSLDTPIADTGLPLVQIYFAILGSGTGLELIDERLEQLGLHIPQELDPVMAAVLGAPKDVSYLNWHDHFRIWRKKRIDLLAREYGDQLDDIADVLSEFAAKLKTFGPRGYLQSIAHKDGEESFIPQADPEE